MKEAILIFKGNTIRSGITEISMWAPSGFAERYAMRDEDLSNLIDNNNLIKITGTSFFADPECFVDILYGISSNGEKTINLILKTKSYSESEIAITLPDIRSVNSILHVFQEEKQDEIRERVLGELI